MGSQIGSRLLSRRLNECVHYFYKGGSNGTVDWEALLYFRWREVASQVGKLGGRESLKSQGPCGEPAGLDGVVGDLIQVLMPRILGNTRIGLF